MTQEVGLEKMVAAIHAMIDDFLCEVLPREYVSGSFRAATSDELEKFLDGSYASADIPKLISHDIEDLIAQCANLNDLFPKIRELEAKILTQLRAS